MESSSKSVIDWLALFVSLIALGVSIWSVLDSSRMSRDSLAATITHDELSLRPILDFQYRFSVGSTPEDGGFLRLANVGEGPAKIVRVTATFDGKPIQTDARSLSDLSKLLNLSAYNLLPGQSLKKDGLVSIFVVPPYSRADICHQDKERKAFFEKLRIEVEYESLYHHEDKAMFSYTSPNQFSC